MASWQEMKTAWSNGERLTCEDMNIIAANINYLYPAANLKENYTQNDYLSVEEWKRIQSALKTLMVISGHKDEIPGSAMTGDTFTDISELVVKIKERLDLNFAQKVANIYPRETHGVYVANPARNYTRGV